MEVQTGDIIKIENSDHKKVVGELISDNQTAQVAFSQASELLKITNDKLWKTIFELFPEIDEFNASINHTTFEIQIRNKK